MTKYTSYRKNGQIHWTGPLKVRMIDEELQFTKYGIWKGFYETGELLSEAVINSKGQIVHEKIYEKEGTLTAEIIGYDETSRGELVRKEKIINYYIDSNKDTLNIKTFTINGDKSIQDGIEKHFDRNGKVIKLIEYKDGEEQKNNS